MKEIKTADDIAMVIALRDGIELREARQIIYAVQLYLSDIILSGGRIEEAEKFLIDELGLEPDYLEVLL